MSARPPSGGGGGGRRKPPAHSQFKPGQSGNPRGRPPGSKNLATLIENELNRTVPVHENGKKRKVSKRELVVKQAVNKAAAGDPRTLLQLLKHCGGLVESVAATTSPAAVGGEDDQRLLVAFMTDWSESNEGE